jgi:hypothetical protein
MKSVLIFALLISSCATSPVHPAAEQLSFKNARSLVSKIFSPSDALKAIGTPDKIERTEEQEVWTYNLPKTDFQRLSLAFDHSKLRSVLWIPVAPEKETLLVHVQTEIPGLRKVSSEQKSIDELSTTSTYSNDSVSLMHDDGAMRVEAIGWLSPKDTIVTQGK